VYAPTRHRRRYQPTAGFAPGVSFRQLKRSLGIEASRLAPSFDHWHYGRVRDTEVVILHYVVGSGSSATTYTGAAARIDPPLFLGLGISAKPLFEFFSTPYRTGDAFVDAHLRITAFEPARVVECLALGTIEGRELVSQIAANADCLQVSDSIVLYATSGYEHDLAKTKWQLDVVLFVAQRLAWLRRRLTPTPAELALFADWQSFADSVGFAFDQERVTAFGRHHGGHLKIALETEGQQVRTAVNVRFPHPVHVAFSARRTRLPGFLQGLFGQDIKVGAPLFDDLFLITGHPENVVRQMLAQPDLVYALQNLGLSTTEVQLNQDQLFFRVQEALASSDLLRVCETARITCEALFGRLRQLGPYR